MNRATQITLVFLFLAMPGILQARQQDQDENDPVKAKALVAAAIKARGGDAYLKVRQTVTRGEYTGYEKGVSGNPQQFVDYIAPGRERTEFGKGDFKYVQTNSDTANWIYDAKAKQIKEQTQEQIDQFKQGARNDLDNLLRLGASGQGVRLIYLGRREPWRSQFSEAVQFEYSDGGSATVHFDSRSHLPLCVEYKAMSAEGKGPVTSQTRFFRWVEYGGVLFPTVQDFYRDGQQSARVNYDEVNLNANLPDKLFARPGNLKEVK